MLLSMALGERKIGHFVQDLLLVAAAVSQSSTVQYSAAQGFTGIPLSQPSSLVIAYDCFASRDGAT
jgi:hypothetical protein